MCLWYVGLLARRPEIVILLLSVSVVGLTFISFGLQTVPDFSDPTVGFETRGTSISDRLIAYKNLMRNPNYADSLVTNPNDMLHQQRHELLAQMTPDQRRQHRKQQRQQLRRTIATNQLLIAELRRTNPSRKDKRPSKRRTLRTADQLHIEQTTQVAVADVAVGEETDSELAVDSDEAADSEAQSDDDDDGDATDEATDKPPAPPPPIEGINIDGVAELFGINRTSIDTWAMKQTVLDAHQKWKDVQSLKAQPMLRQFCGEPKTDYIHFVMQQRDGVQEQQQSMFRLDVLSAMCQLERRMTAAASYREVCERQPEAESGRGGIGSGSNDCCLPWSLPNYVAMLAGRKNCGELQSQDVDEVKRLLVACAPAFRAELLGGSGAADRCRRQPLKCVVPAQCWQHGAVHTMLQFLADVDFVGVNSTEAHLSNAMLFLPVARSSHLLPLYFELQQTQLQNDRVKVVAADMGCTDALFEDLLLRQSYLIGCGVLLIVAIMWLYTRSICIVGCTVFIVFSSLTLTYGIYQFCTNMAIFPFLNLLAVIVVVGVGADDMFIFVKMWRCVLDDRRLPEAQRQYHTVSGLSANTLPGLIAITLQHASISMLATSATTAVAFFAAYWSDITAVKCFSLFAGIAICVNYALMILWLPAAVTFADRIPSCYPTRLSTVATGIAATAVLAQAQLERRIIQLVSRRPWLWVITFAALTICSTLAITVYPGIRLPESGQFHLFHRQHIFEQYDIGYASRFPFQRAASAAEIYHLPLHFVWGALPVDNGRHTDPQDTGTIVLDDRVDFATIDAQLWMRSFCRAVREQPFYLRTPGSPITAASCFIDTLVAAMDRPCIDALGSAENYPCCEAHRFPYAPHIFRTCMPRIFGALLDQPARTFARSEAGPRFGRVRLRTEHLLANRSEPLPPVRAIVLEFESRVPATAGFAEVQALQQQVQQWFDAQLLAAPAGLQRGWFISELQFAELQRVLGADTMPTIWLALGCSTIVLIVVTLDFRVSVLALLTVAGTMMTTIACLVWMDWRQNVLECLAVVTSVGLSVDFSLHYGHSYRSGPDGLGRVERSQLAMGRTLGPTMMAAITTAAAGLCMLPSDVLAYIQIGQFLVLVMTVSWLYATFGLMAMLSVVGPERFYSWNGVWSWWRRWRRRGGADRLEAGRVRGLFERSGQCDLAVAAGNAAVASNEPDSYAAGLVAAGGVQDAIELLDEKRALLLLQRPRVQVIAMVDVPRCEAGNEQPTESLEPPSGSAEPTPERHDAVVTDVTYAEVVRLGLADSPDCAQRMLKEMEVEAEMMHSTLSDVWAFDGVTRMWGTEGDEERLGRISSM